MLATWALALNVALVGCGSGGNDNGDSEPPNVGSVDVTASNQDALARALALATRGGFAGGLALTDAGSARGGTPAPALSPLVQRSPLLTPIGRKRALAVIGPQTDDCLAAGSTATTLDDRDDSQSATAGDRLTLVFDNCRDDTQETLNGRLHATLTALTATPAFSFSANVTLDELGVGLPGQRNAVYVGDFVLSAAETSATTVDTRLVVGSQLAARINTPSFSDTITLRAGHTIDISVDTQALPPGGTQPGLVSTAANGSVASASAGGYLIVRTLQPLVQYVGDSAPRAGRVEGVGRTGSLQLHALPEGQVRIELDADGNGVAEQTRTVTWDWLF